MRCIQIHCISLVIVLADRHTFCTVHASRLQFMLSVKVSFVQRGFFMNLEQPDVAHQFHMYGALLFVHAALFLRHGALLRNDCS